MSEKGHTTKTLVRVMVEVQTGTYGPEWTLGAMQKQAAEEGRARVRQIMRGDPNKMPLGSIIGEPEVITIVSEPIKGLFGP